MGFLQVLQFPPSVRGHAGQANKRPCVAPRWVCEWMVVCVCPAIDCRPSVEYSFFSPSACWDALQHRRPPTLTRKKRLDNQWIIISFLARVLDAYSQGEQRRNWLISVQKKPRQYKTKISLSWWMEVSNAFCSGVQCRLSSPLLAALAKAVSCDRLYQAGFGVLSARNPPVHFATGAALSPHISGCFALFLYPEPRKISSHISHSATMSGN